MAWPRDLTKAALGLLLVGALASTLGSVLVGCGSNGPSTPSAAAAGVASSISLGTDVIAVPSDNSAGAVITATLLNSTFAIVPGVPVTFSATGGTLSASTVISDAQGQASITFRSGTVDQSNQVVTITATASGVSALIPIQVTGTTLTLSAPQVNLVIGGPTETLTVLARNSAGVPIRNATVTLAVTGTGNATLSAATGVTDINGQLQVTVTGTVAGTATVTATGLGTTGSFDFAVAGAAATVFRITAPATSPASLATNTDLTVTVTAPAGVTSVTFATTIGTWDGGASSVVTKAIAGTASATLRSTVAGLATVQAYDTNVPSTSATIQVAFYAPAAEAAFIDLQSDSTVVGLSVGGVTCTANLRATVLNLVNQPVGNAAVFFSILNSTGGGEFLSPVVAFTDAAGIARATFTSGTKSATVNITAALVATPALVDGVSILIGGQAGSVVIGTGNKVTIVDPTQYALPMSVLVADAAGGAVAGATVSLSLWPVQYHSGVWYDSYPPNDNDLHLWLRYLSGTFDNDDVNENGIRDPGEAADPFGAMRPANSAAGSLPPSVRTDANGVATFNLVYLKAYAGWIRARVRASTLALGTETASSTTFTLPAERAEGEAGDLPNSPFPLDLQTTSGGTVTFNAMPPFGLYPPTTYSTLLNTFSTAAAGTYTFTDIMSAPVGTVYDDYVFAQDTGPIHIEAPVRILIIP